MLAEICRDVRFRRPLSLALNRKEINETKYYGLGVAGQLGASSVLPWFDKEKQDPYAYTEYDPEKANRLLDAMKLKWDRSNEYRLRSDGKTLSIVVNPLQEHIAFAEIATLAVEHWKEIGVGTIFKLQPIPYLFKRSQTGELEIVTDYRARGAVFYPSDVAG